MKNLKKQFKNHLAAAAVPLSIILMATASPKAEAQAPLKVKNIVIVHGAFADGSGWRGVYDVLVAKGYHVSIVQNPLTSMEADVAAVKVILARQDGPVILVGHSYGGAVITQAGIDPKVVGLVYVAAFQPEVGESALDLAKTKAPSQENGIVAPDENGYFFYSKEKFFIGFAAGLTKAESDFMYDSQGPVSLEAFNAPMTAAAWKTKPSWGIVSTEDKSIQPDIERFVYKRSGAIVTEIKASHVVYMTHPKEVAQVIIEASLKSPIK
ncbi:alpha/beta hydrolase [Mucilaginibacter aquariorum]|uniref:Alpha/beta hydrolase n=1 Tax=Mucilaginibacter aquariorum TaxID=2967225 RepID=A0ABT1SZE2_9SPHI|nr:alpha/beta hydrolase [Mucilaginibacter aquariorum]MCQ6957707.1 alpha/beta hydrolase [Mucilaginibacter aquariorum]